MITIMKRNIQCGICLRELHLGAMNALDAHLSFIGWREAAPRFRFLCPQCTRAGIIGAVLKRGLWEYEKEA